MLFEDFKHVKPRFGTRIKLSNLIVTMTITVIVIT